MTKTDQQCLKAFPNSVLMSGLYTSGSVLPLSLFEISFLAPKVNSNKKDQKQEEKHVFNSLVSNGYPKAVFTECEEKTQTQFQHRNNDGLVVLP